MGGRRGWEGKKGGKGPEDKQTGGEGGGVLADCVIRSVSV